MLSAISLTIYQYRKYLVLSLIISMIAIPIAHTIVIQRDRNRNEMYGEAFWIYGFSVYNYNDHELAAALPPGWGYNDGLHTLPDYLGNITYEYPVFGLIFFAIATFLYPGQGGLQPLWLNFLLTLVFNLNLVLIAILLKERIYTKNWARLFFGGYYIYGLILSAGGGKLEPIVDCLLLMALVLREEGQYGKAMFTLGLSVQTKIYSVVALPILFLSSPVSLVWFFVSTLLTIIPFTFLGANFDSLVSHFLNTSSYSSFIVNPFYPGLFLATQDFAGGNPDNYYLWPPALIPFIIFSAYILFTIRPYLPSKQDFLDAGWWDKIKLLKPFYIYLLPGILFLFRWVMPWYLMWLALVVLLFEEDEHIVGYLKLITVVGLLYAFGAICNWPYFINGPLPDFMSHFPYEWWTLLGMFLLVFLAGVAYFIWKKTFDRRERKALMIQAAKDRGELVL
ncbi:MAG: hypothetical protein EAX95_00545 [Candidatus Thorarchaeota archaeon]|nr:hypothetical protein [Candidatus Thorarchaeota archaeon]